MHTMHLSSIDLNLLVALDALLTERSVTRAARRVGLSQSAMSHALNRLRETFDDPLLVRAGRAMTLTPRAQELAIPLREILARLEEVVAPPTPFDPATSQQVFRVAANEYPLFALMPLLTERMSRMAPRVDLRVRDLGQTPYLPRLESGEVDAALTLGLARHIPDTLYKLPLFELDLVCVVRFGHPRIKDRLDLDAFCQEPHVLISPAGDDQGAVDYALAELDRSRRVAVVVPHFLLAPHIIARTDYILTTAATVAESFRGHLPIRILPPPLELLRGVVHLVWHPRTHHDEAHRWFRRFIQETNDLRPGK
jgi:DNA-binding transcriptional LysR family regulator